MGGGEGCWSGCACGCSGCCAPRSSRCSLRRMADAAREPVPTEEPIDASQEPPASASGAGCGDEAPSLLGRANNQRIGNSGHAVSTCTASERLSPAFKHNHPAGRLLLPLAPFRWMHAGLEVLTTVRCWRLRSPRVATWLLLLGGWSPGLLHSSRFDALRCGIVTLQRGWWRWGALRFSSVAQYFTPVQRRKK